MSKKIYIDPGHSITDPGAVGFAVERDLNEKVSKFMNEYLLANYECETKVDPITTNSTIDVAKAANSWEADLFVSNHFNAGGGDGYEALVYSAKMQPLGELFVKHVKAIGQNSRGVKLRPGLSVLKRTNMPAVLNEGAFVDNKKDIQDWDDDSELKKLGEAYAKAAAEFLKLPKKKAVNTKPKVETENTSGSASTPTSNYSLKEFIKDVQKATGSAVDGIAGTETLSKTITVSAKTNYRHAVVKCIQKRLLALGYVEIGVADGVAGPKFTSAVKHYQRDNGCTADGVITAKNKTWKKLLGMA